LKSPIVVGEGIGTIDYPPAGIKEVRGDPPASCGRRHRRPEEETDMPGEQSERRVTRRTLIKGAGAAGITVYMLWSSPTWLGPRLALAANLTALDGAQAKEMLAMTRALVPHDKLGDEYYWVVVEAIDKDMAGSPELATRIRDGLVQLNQAAGGDFATADTDKQVAAIKKLEGTPFFADMLNKTQFNFYNNKAVWSKFGYEGSSWEKGGYIDRGFNDVKWTDG
jgi:hypothetical protein